MRTDAQIKIDGFQALAQKLDPRSRALCGNHKPMKNLIIRNGKYNYLNKTLFRIVSQANLVLSP